MDKYDPFGPFLESYENTLAWLSVRSPFLDWVGWLHSMDDTEMIELGGHGPWHHVSGNEKTESVGFRRLDGSLMTDWRERDIFVVALYLARWLINYVIYGDDGMRDAVHRCGAKISCRDMSIGETYDAVIQQVKDLQDDEEHERDMALLLLGDSLHLYAELTMREFDAVPLFYPLSVNPDKDAPPEALLLTRELDGERLLYGSRFDWSAVKCNDDSCFTTDGGWFLWKQEIEHLDTMLVGRMKVSFPMFAPSYQILFTGYPSETAIDTGREE